MSAAVSRCAPSLRRREADEGQILAGPGSGKTKALTSRVAYLIKDRALDAKRLLVCTFTNKVCWLRPGLSSIHAADSLGVWC